MEPYYRSAAEGNVPEWALGDDDELQFQEWEDAYNLSEADAYERYDDTLDEANPGQITISGTTFSPSYALKNLDPIAYRTGFSDYVDTLREDGTIVEGWES